MDVQKELIEHILKNNVSRVKEILLAHNFKPDDCDENGMTPLQHAAFKGNKDIVQLLLDQVGTEHLGNLKFDFANSLSHNKLPNTLQSKIMNFFRVLM